MAAPIRIGTLDAADASDLRQALAARGLIGRLRGTGGRRWVEVSEAHEDTRRLLADVTIAVETWLAEHDRPSLEIRVEEVVHYVARPTLSDALRARVQESARNGQSA